MPTKNINETNYHEIIENYKKALRQRDRVIELQQEIINFLKSEKKKLLEVNLN